MTRRALATPVSVMDDTAPTLWRDMTDAQKGALLLAVHEGKVVEARGDATSGEWKAMTNGVYLLDHCAYRIRSLPIEEFSQACGIFDTHEAEDPLDLLFYQVQDPKYFIHDSNLPAITTILHKVCQNDDARFDEATRLITLFMQAAYEKGKSDQ